MTEELTPLERLTGKRRNPVDVAPPPIVDSSPQEDRYAFRRKYPFPALTKVGDEFFVEHANRKTVYVAGHHYGTRHGCKFNVTEESRQGVRGVKVVRVV